MRCKVAVSALVVGGVVGFAIAPRSAAVPGPTRTIPVTCTCNPDWAEANYQCEDESYSDVNVVVLDPGTCLDPLEFCFDEDPCAWEYSLVYKSTEGDAVLRAYWNGMARARGQAELEIGPLNMQLDCGDPSASVAIGSNGNICIEAVFECVDCP